MSGRLITVAEALATFDAVGSSREDRERSLLPWRRLAAEAQVPNAFLTPEVLLPALRHLAGDQVVLAVVERDGRWRLMTPLRLRGRAWRHPVRTAHTWEHDQAFLGTPLVSPDASAADWQELLACARRRGDRWLVMALLDTVIADQVGEAVAAIGEAGVRVCPSDRGRSDAADGPALDAPLTSKRRRDVRRLLRRLEAELGATPLIEDLAVPRDGEDEPTRRSRLRGDLQRFVALEEAGWKGRDGGAMAVRTGESAFFIEACLAAADRGALLLPALRQGDRLIAAGVQLKERDTVFWWKTTYDEAYAACSPGLLTVVASIDQLGPDVRVIDSCTDPDSTLGSSLTTGRRPLTTMAVSLGSPVGRGVVRRLPAWLAMRERSAPVRPAREGSPRSRPGSTRRA